jgi:hypothetical protein
MGVKNFLKSRSGLKVDNRKTTSAATLTLRQSLWPLTLVTLLFFLWVMPKSSYSICRYHTLTPTGFRIRSTRYPKQTLPEYPPYRPRPVIRSPSRVLWVCQFQFQFQFQCQSHFSFNLPSNPLTNQRIPTRLPGLRKLDPPPLRLQDRLHLRSRAVWHRSIVHVASRATPIIRWLLRSDLRHWLRFGIARDRCEPLPNR